MTTQTQTKLRTIAATVLRLSLGTIFLSHGLWKVLTLGLPTTVGYFASQGFPRWTAYLVVAGEIGGGVLMILGVQTRAIALLDAADPDRRPAACICRTASCSRIRTGGWEYPAFLIRGVAACRRCSVTVPCPRPCSARHFAVGGGAFLSEHRASNDRARRVAAAGSFYCRSRGISPATKRYR